MARHWAALAAACILILLATNSTAAVDDQSILLRNHNPFLQIFGLPPFQNASLASDGQIEYGIYFDVANHADADDASDESVIIDGESIFLSLSLRYRARPWLEVGLDLPFISHSGGTLDQSVESWHKIWGLPDNERGGPRDQLRFFFDSAETGPYELASSASGVGDIQLTAAMPLSGEDDPDRPAITLRTSLKLPTGDSETLMGSGATDLSVGLYVTDDTFANGNLSLSGFAGVLLLGKGDVLPEVQERTVWFAGISTTWQATAQFGVTLQVNAQSPYFDTSVAELGGKSVQGALGGSYRFRNSRYSLSIAIVEDLFSNATSDMALQVAVSTDGGQ